MLDFRIILEARNPDRRCFRQYRVEAGTDLFGSWVVEISYGRMGTAERSRCFVVRDEGEAQASGPEHPQALGQRRDASGSRTASAS